MRIRIDGVDLGVAREARLALRHAGFVLSEESVDADYVVSLKETDSRMDDVVIGGTDGRFERDIINRLATTRQVLVLDRSGERNDQAIAISIPAVDELRRVVSRALVEIFLTYVNRALPSPTTQPVVSSSNGAAFDRMVQHLIDVDRAHTETVHGLLKQLDVCQRRRWWQIWSAHGE